MEKIGNDEWTSNSVTSTFRIKHKNGRPIGCVKEDDYVFTKACGLGWKFGIRHDDASPEIGIYFDCSVIGQGIGVIVVVATLQQDSTQRGAKGFNSKQETLTRQRSNRGRDLIKWWHPADIIELPFVSFLVTFTGVQFDVPKPLPAPDSEPTAKLLDILARSLYTGAFIDTQFLVFSRRCAKSGILDLPRPVFANGSILSSESEYLKKALSVDANSFSDASLVPVEGDSIWEVQHQQKQLADYDYADDSDLEDDDDGEPPAPPSYDFLNAPPDTKDTNTQSLAGVSTAEHVSYPVAFQGRVMLVTDFALTTWRALVHYLYTGEVAFTSLQSKLSSRSLPRATDAKKENTSPPPCSPKSMYRLAVKMGLNDLEERAFLAIHGDMTPGNVLNEACSKFSSGYPKVLEMQIRILCERLEAPEVKDALPLRLAEIAEGKLPHCPSFLVAFYKALRAENGSKERAQG